MYLKDSNKKLETFEEFRELFKKVEEDEKNNDIAFRFFKYFITEMLDNVSEVGDYHYSISEDDIESMASDMVGNDTIWQIIDEHILEELENYEMEGESNEK